MLTSDIYDCIRKIADTSSKNEKQAMIERWGRSEFQRVLRYAYDPFMRFGIAKVDKVDVEAAGDFDDVTWKLLDDLAERRLTGGAAINAVHDEMAKLNIESQKLLEDILKKDLRAGFSASTINKAIPGLVPTFDCMLAHKFEPERIKVWPQIVETKLDGVRTLAFINLKKSTVYFYSRSGKEFTTLDHLKQPILDAAYGSRFALDGALEFVLDGEAISGNFTKTVSEIKRKSEHATDMQFHAFDILPTITFSKEDKDGCLVAGTYEKRRFYLEDLVKCDTTGLIKATQQYICNSHSEMMGIYDKVRGRGLEGLIIKSPKGLYHRRRNHSWMKLKNESTVDVPIIGFEEGTGKAAGSLGAFIVDMEGVKVNVGSGLSDVQRAEFWTVEAGKELLGRLIEVEYHEKTPDGSLRHPRFVRFRDDKPVSDGIGV